MKNIRKILIILVLHFISFSLFAQQEKVQAAFMYNFTKYMEWPASYRNGDFVIGVINDANMVSALNSMVAGKQVGMQKITVKSFNSVNSVSDCHMVYLPENLSGFLDDLFNKLKGKGTLIITNKDGLAQKGADINFVIVSNKQSFEINKNNISKKSVSVNSRLEELAAKVY